MFDRPIFETLKREGVPATIFVSGRWVEGHPDAMEELASSPLIEFGDHSYDHPHMPELTPPEMAQRDRRDRSGARALRQAQHRVPPAVTASSAPHVLAVLAHKGLPPVLWDVVSGDPSAGSTAEEHPAHGAEEDAAGIDHRLPHQRARMEDRGGDAVGDHRAAPARVSLRAPVGDAGGAPGARACRRRRRNWSRHLRPAGARRDDRARRQAAARIVRASPALARAQAAWIVGIEPWASLGYRAQPLGRWLARAARARGVWVARGGARRAPSRGHHRRRDAVPARRLHRAAGGASRGGGARDRPRAGRARRASRCSLSPASGGCTYPPTAATAPRWRSIASSVFRASAACPI